MNKSFWSLFEEPPRNASSGIFQNLMGEIRDNVHAETGDPAEGMGSADSNSLRFDEDYVYWAMRYLPLREAAKHFLAVGASGSGKTTLIQLFLKSIGPRFQPGWRSKHLKEKEPNRPEQLIVFDAKGDTVSSLAKHGLTIENENLFIINPYDARSAVWNVAEALTSPVMARSFATLIVPEEKNSSAPFFANAARELVYNVIISLNLLEGKNWTLRDLLCALQSRDYIADITSHNEGTRAGAAPYLNDSQHSGSILSSLASTMNRLEQAAALWHTNTSGIHFSIQDFLKRPGALVLGNDPVLRDSFWPLNALLLKALTNEILRLPDTLHPRCWFILDEFRAMEKVECIHELLNRGRSKGASVLLGTQSVEGLMELYGENVANDILSQCANKTFLRAGGPKTAEWAENHFNKVRQHEQSVTESRSKNSGWSRSVQTSLHDRPFFLASYFLNLPFPVSGQTLKAVCDVPCMGETLIVERPFDSLLALCGKKINDDGNDTSEYKVPDVVPRENPHEQRLIRWSEKEKAKYLSTSQSIPDNKWPKPKKHPLKTGTTSKPKLPKRREVNSKSRS